MVDAATVALPERQRSNVGPAGLFHVLSLAGRAVSVEGSGYEPGGQDGQLTTATKVSKCRHR